MLKYNEPVDANTYITNERNSGYGDIIIANRCSSM